MPGDGSRPGAGRGGADAGGTHMVDGRRVDATGARRRAPAGRAGPGAPAGSVQLGRPWCPGSAPGARPLGLRARGLRRLEARAHACVGVLVLTPGTACPARRRPDETMMRTQQHAISSHRWISLWFAWDSFLYDHLSPAAADRPVAGLRLPAALPVPGPAGRRRCSAGTPPGPAADQQRGVPVPALLRATGWGGRLLGGAGPADGRRAGSPGTWCSCRPPSCSRRR